MRVRAYTRCVLRSGARVVVAAVMLVSSLPLMAQSDVWEPSVIPPEALRADLAILRSALEEAHPGYTRYRSREEADRLFDSVVASITEPLSQEAFYRRVQPLIVAIGDGHTKFHPDTVWGGYSYFNRDRQLPLRLHVVGERAWVRWAPPSAGIPIGAELLSVNDRPLSEILATLFSLSSYGDGNGPGGRRLDIGDQFYSYYGNFIGSADTYVLAWLPPADDGAVAAGGGRTTALPAVDSAVLEALLPPLPVVSADPDGVELVSLGSTASGDPAAILRVSSFAPSAGRRAFERALDGAFGEIREAGVQRLVIDLRDNEGGTDALGALLFSYLSDEPFDYYDRIEVVQKRPFAMREHMDLPWFFPVYRALLQPARDAATAVPRYTWPFKRETREQRPVRDPFRGEAVILVNGRSFSVTSEFAAIARSSGRARVVGEETGGGYSGNTSGFFAITRLPNSRLIVGIPLWGYYLAVEPIQPLDRGVIPTVTVVPEIGDIMAGRDPVVSAALALPRDP